MAVTAGANCGALGVSPGIFKLDAAPDAAMLRYRFAKPNGITAPLV